MIGFDNEIDDFGEELLMAGLRIPYSGVKIQVPDATKILNGAMEYFLGRKGDRYIPQPEYLRVAEWLEDNKGKGLFMYGSCGRGKTILAKYVIPAILWKYSNGKRMRYYDIYELDIKIDEIMEQRYISLDDVGTESMAINYGKRRVPFAELMDAVEKEGKLIVLTSGMAKEDVLQRYGERIYERLVATTARIPFQGESLRRI